MKSCKVIHDGKPCLNEADEGQEYCPYHLASQVADEKKFLSNLLWTFGSALTAASIVSVGKTVIGKVVKFIASKRL